MLYWARCDMGYTGFGLEGMNELLIKMALSIVKPLGEKYPVKEDVCYLMYEDTDDDVFEFDGSDCEDYCEDCIGDIVVDAHKKIKSGEYREPEDYKNMTYSIMCSPESEGFEHCEACGEIINSGKIWNSQEMEHWLGLSDDEWKVSMKYKSCHYQLMEILDDNDGAIEEYPKECSTIAGKIIQFYK